MTSLKKIVLYICLLTCIVAAKGQNIIDFETLKERSAQAIEAKDINKMLLVEKDFDGYYADVTHRSAEVKYEYVVLKLHISYRYIHIREYKKAEETLLFVLPLCENFPKSKLLAYSALGQCYSFVALDKEAHDNYADAIQYSLLSISYSSMAQKEERVTSQYVKLGREYTHTGQYDKAKESFNEAEKRIAENSINSKYLAELTYEKAQLEKKKENYSVSVDLFIKSYDLYIQSNTLHKEAHLQSCAKSISDLYRFNLHNAEKAAYWDGIYAKHAQNTKDIDQDTPSDKEMLASKRKLLDILKIQSNKQYATALSQYQQFIQEIEGKSTYDNQYLKAECLKNSGLCHMQLRQFPEAVKCLNLAISVYLSVNEKPSVVDCYTYSSYAYYHNKDITNAIASAQQSLNVAKECYDSESKQLADCYYNSANLYAIHGDAELAKKHLLGALEIKERDIRSTFSYLTSQERDKYWNTMQKDIGNIQPFLLRLNEKQSQYTDAMYDVQLLTKGLLLQSDIQLQLLSNSDSHLSALLTEIIAIKKKLQQNNLPLDTITFLKQKAEQLERSLTISSKDVGDFLHFLDVTHKDVKRNLTNHAVAIEFATFKYSQDSLLTVAYVMKKDWEHVMALPLYEEKEMQSLMSASRNHETDLNHLYTYDANGANLSALVWGKILPFIHSGDSIYFAPSGSLHVLAIETLPYDSTQTMSDVYNIVRLSSTRELALHKDSIAHTAATLYGGIKYHVSADVMYANNQRYRDIDREGIKDLLGTKLEMEAIAPILRDHNVEVHVFSADTANEESFKALSGKKQNILHIGTHGFYWTDSTAQSAAYFKQRTLSIGNDQYAPKTIDPLNRCGLLFAGASTAISGDAHRLQDGVQDGVLTAKEISLMDLRDADIVVLSACETGLGDVTGDGVFGLQRAFKMAGARTILMSLWKVDDDATRMLMTSFYRYYANGMSKRAAFRKAQQEVRNYTGTVEETESTDRAAAQDRFKNKGKLSSQTEPVQQMKEGTPKYPYQSPYHWAGFILLD